MDIAAGPINDSPLPNLSTRRSGSDGDCCELWLVASSLLLKADDSNDVFLCLANLKQRTSS